MKKSKQQQFLEGLSKDDFYDLGYGLSVAEQKLSEQIGLALMKGKFSTVKKLLKQLADSRALNREIVCFKMKKLEEVK